MKTAIRSFIVSLHFVGIFAGLFLAITTHDTGTEKLLVSMLILLVLNLLRLFQSPH